MKETKKAEAQEAWDNKTILINSIPNILSIIIVYVMIFIFHVSFKWILGFIFISSNLMSCFFAWKRRHFSLMQFIKSNAKLGIMLTVIYYLNVWLGPYGLLGLILISASIAGYRLYKGRVMFMAGLRRLESQIWGKPLDKAAWPENTWKKRRRLF